MEEKVEVIQDTLDVQQEVAHKALELADQDLEEALEKAKLINEDYLILQGKLKYGGYNKVYGLFNLVLNGTEGEFIKIDATLNDNHKLWEVDLTVNNKVFVKTIKGFVPLTKQTNKDLTFTNIFNPAQIFELFRLVKEDNLQEVTSFFKEELERYLEETIELELTAELKSKLQLTNSQPQLFTDEEEESEESDEPEEPEDDKLGLDIKLKCTPFISPAQGKRPDQLRLGEELIVKIVDKREVGLYFKDLLTDEESQLVTGKIIAINFKPQLDRYSIIVKFGPQICGKVTTGTQIKLATSQIETEPETDRTTTQESDDSQELVYISLLAGMLIIFLLLSINIYF